MNLLLTSIGKRIQLIEHLKTQFRVVGVDASLQNPARRFVDAFYQIPRCKEDGYIETLVKICKQEKIDLLIPLFELEFSYLNEAREQFEAIGVKLILSEKPVIDICNDKLQTAGFFRKYNVPAPYTLSEQEVQALLTQEGEQDSYPLIIKPLDGMGSEGVFRISSRKELEFFRDYVKNPMIQKCASGTEYTIDALCDLQGKPVFIVPRIRLEVRSGEVTKSRTVKQEIVIRETEKLLEALNQEGRVIGPMTIQCFLEENGESEKKPEFIEINPRFGGGVPLSFAAGADYAEALKKMCEGKTLTYQRDFSELTMMRYDQAVYE
ncbi:MAG: ATP-grasp domain-containing protein [Lachnospiraceae bacterium]